MTASFIGILEAGIEGRAMVGTRLNPSERALERWRMPTFEHGSVAAFLAADALQTGVHTILGEESPIDILIRGRRGKPLIFSFHGNTPRSPELMLPVFTGRNVTRDLQASFVALSDPTLCLDADLRLAWFAGSERLRLQVVLPAILRKIAEALAAPRVLFFGGSAGGYASLHYSVDFPNSLSLVWNPQTELTRYNPPHLEDYGRAAFGWETLEETKRRLPTEIAHSLAARYAPPRRNLLLYMQNNSDGHVTHHLRPFLASLGVDTAALGPGSVANRAVTPEVWLYLAGWGEGHASPPPEFLTHILEGLLALPDWRTAYAEGHLAALLTPHTSSTAEPPASLGQTSTA